MSEIIKIRVKQNPEIITGGTSGGGNIYYTGVTPSNLTVGGIASGSVLTGRTFTQLFQDLLITYLSPAFTSFSISGQATIIEVGTALSGSKTFTWSTSNSSNISGNTINIRDVNSNTLIATNTSNDGSQSVNIGTITNTLPITQSWRGEAIDTHSIALQSSNFTVSSIYPYYYGKVSSGGAAPGVNRPAATAALITGGTKVLASSTGTITINFNSTNDDYVWFAIPSISTSKTVWFINSLNTGSIGGAVSAGGNLFPANDTVSVTTVNWSGVSYKLYIANYQSQITSNMELRNS